MAEVDTVGGAKELLDKASAMQTYATKAGIELEKPIAIGVLKIKIKLGELMPAKARKETGRGKKTMPRDGIVFHPHTVKNPIRVHWPRGEGEPSLVGEDW